MRVEGRAKKMKLRNAIGVAGIAVLLAAAFFAGYYAKSHPSHEHAASDNHAAAGQPTGQKWYCSMDPQIIREGPGLCPICGMDLIPMPAGPAGNAGPRELVVSEAAAKLMDIETAAVERRFVAAEVRMVGKVDYDETRLKHITAWVPGRIDGLYVDFKGIRVNKGDHMVELYSPDLISAQAELLQAVKAAASSKAEASDLVRRSTQATLVAAREKLRLLGLNAEQIEGIERSGEALTHITVYSPIGGVVIEKHATEGMYVDTGTHIYTVADLSRLWVKLDAYESDLPWIRYGQEVQFTAEAYPGELFKGRISFRDPVLDSRTRTVKLRVNVENPDEKLQPGMFVRAVVKSNVAGVGRVMDPNMAGKWICPMHPAVVRAEAGDCDICGMDLVTTESLGYVTADATQEAPLVIPASAPLITGKRAIVYVRQQDANEPTFEGREIVLGPRAGDYYVVEAGLAEGELVVKKGNFKIDSALQLQAKPSMMSPQGGAMPVQHQHGAGRQEHTKEPTAKAGEQTKCPVMGGNINKKIFTEYKGKKVYFCCPGCIDEFLKNPEKYMAKLPQFRE
ncbi:MAG: efflux RND transporter periplasmic adaptor subunit [Phycisphaerales bacterium]|nr:MAG: efflux RND transporter periplasmic adaptor subunit [Phycisphaerales bacterium]